MVLLRSPTPTLGSPTLNAIAQPRPTDHAARRERNLRHCEELVALGMELARAAHVEALRDLQPPTIRRHIPGTPPSTATDARSDTFGHLFAQLARSVRQTILLETRLAAGSLDHPIPDPSRAANPAPPTAPPIPARATTQDAPRLRPERLEDDHAADANRAPAEILAGICADLGAALDTGLTPDRPDPAAPTPRPPTRIPPPREAPLSALERSAIAYHQRASPNPER
jgi:hypothetical protein